MGDQATQPLVFELTLDRASDPISGRLSLAGSPSSSFTGWLGLVAAVERLSEVQAAAASAHDPSRTPAS